MTTIDAPLGRLPAENRRHIGHGRGAVDAKMQKFDPHIGHDLHRAKRVAGHVGHLGGAGRHAKTAVEFAGDAERLRAAGGATSVRYGS